MSITYSTYVKLKTAICRNANVPISVSVEEWRQLMLRHSVHTTDRDSSHLGDFGPAWMVVPFDSVDWYVPSGLTLM